MSKKITMALPAWVTPEKHQLFAVRLASLHYSETGQVAALSSALGGSRSMLHMSLKQGGLSAATCIKLEELLGRENFPREFFRPDIFIPASEQ